MKCRPAVITLSLLAVFFFSLFTSSSVFAVSDVTLTINSSNWTTASTLCDSFTNSPVSCSDFKYIIIESTGYAPRSWINYYYEPSQSNSNTYSMQMRHPVTSPSVTVFDLPDGFKYFRFMSINYYSDITDSDFSVTITLTETDPSGDSDCPVCPEPEEPEPCPVIPDNPYDEKLDNITLAIYTCGAVVLVIYFFYCIYRMIIKTVGGV